MNANLIRHARQRKSVEADALTWSLQTLLSRHEAYVSEAEARHAADATNIADLSTKATTLEAENARLREENEGLVTQAEGLSTALSESENRVKSLTATLRDTQNELARMRILAAKADRLEQQLVQVEMERSILQDSVIKSEEEGRRVRVRWHASERTLQDLESQIECMEAESQKANEAQKEMQERAERQRAIQDSIERHRREVTGAAQAGERSVLANFVKDILEDNAGLQLDIAELKELLLRSQTETEDLRSQLAYASPMHQTGASITPTALTPTIDLQSELQSHLGLGPPSRISSPQLPQLLPYPLPQAQPYIGPKEIHIHHHTHLGSPSTTNPPLSSSLPSTTCFTRPPYRHGRHISSRSSIRTMHSRQESAASSVPSTVFESASDGGYDTDITNITNLTRPTSPDSDSAPGALAPFSPLDDVLEKPLHRPPLRRRGSNESILSVSGMDIHNPGPTSFRRITDTASGRPEVSRNHASGSSNVTVFAPGESAAGQALRDRLQERERMRTKKGYNPIKDTFGGWRPWGGSGGGTAKREEKVGRRVGARVRTEVVDREGLKACLEEVEE